MGESERPPPVWTGAYTKNLPGHARAPRPCIGFGDAGKGHCRGSAPPGSHTMGAAVPYQPSGSSEPAPDEGGRAPSSAACDARAPSWSMEPRRAHRLRDAAPAG